MGYSMITFVSLCMLMNLYFIFKFGFISLNLVSKKVIKMVKYKLGKLPLKKEFHPKKFMKIEGLYPDMGNHVNEVMKSAKVLNPCELTEISEAI
jgi:hypothetical protein